MWGFSDPFPAVHDQHGVVLLLAVSESGALIVCDDGQLRFEDYTHLRSEWRFNWTTHKWEDDDIGELYDETGDGGSEISGDVPELDGADGGDPGDKADGTDRDVVPG